MIYNKLSLYNGAEIQCVFLFAMDAVYTGYINNTCRYSTNNRNCFNDQIRIAKISNAIQYLKKRNRYYYIMSPCSLDFVYTLIVK